MLAQGIADFAARRYDDAASRLREVALGHLDPAVGLDATKLYLEALNVLGSTQSRTDCFDDMASDVPKLRELYCRFDSAHKDSDGCASLERIQVDISRLRAQRVVEEADKDGGDGAQMLYEKGGRLYLETFREFCEEPVAGGRTLRATASGCIEIAYNAARSFNGARLGGKAVAAYRTLIAFDQRTRSASPLAARAAYELGGRYQSMALYSDAAEWFEKYATANPRSPHADHALSDAVILRLGLGQDVEATRDAAAFAKNWGITRRAESAQLALAIATHHAEHDDKDKARAMLTSAMDMLDRGPPDLQLAAHALLARVAPTLAKEEYAKVRALWRDPAAALGELRRGWPGDDDVRRDRRLARALNAVGEAAFAAGEERRVEEVVPLAFPSYTGAADRASILAHLQTRVRPWFAKKKSAIERTEAEYIKVLELKPVPPPVWVIAAGGAIGLMWGDLADDFRRVPIPDAWRKDRDLYRVYYGAIEEMSESIRSSRAKPAMRKCLDLAAKYQVVDARSRACESWLGANYKSELHVVDELIPALTRGGGPSAMPPLSYEGQPRRNPYGP